MLEWQETTLRKGTKTPKICRDMFIADSNGNYQLCKVKNGKLSSCEQVTKRVANLYIARFSLVFIDSTFADCRTYRTVKSQALVSNAIMKQTDND